MIIILCSPGIATLQQLLFSDSAIDTHRYEFVNSTKMRFSMNLHFIQMISCEECQNTNVGNTEAGKSCVIGAKIWLKKIIAALACSVFKQH